MNKKKIVIIVLSILALVVIAGVVVFLNMDKKNNNKQKETEAATALVETVTENPGTSVTGQEDEKNRMTRLVGKQAKSNLQGNRLPIKLMETIRATIMPLTFLLTKQ